MAEQKTYYTYISYEADSDKFYIGSTSCIGKPENHKYLGSGKAIATGEFKPAWKWIYGTYPDRKSAGLAEEQLIRQADYSNNPLCMNKYCTGSNHTNDAIEKQSLARQGQNHPLYGKKHTEEAKAKISQAKKGKKLSEEHKAKLSKAWQGQNHPLYGKRHTDEAKAKMSAAKKGKKRAAPIAEETRAKLSKLNAGLNNPQSDKNIYKFVHEDGRIAIGTYYELKQDCNNVLGISASSLRWLRLHTDACIKGWRCIDILGTAEL